MQPGARPMYECVRCGLFLTEDEELMGWICRACQEEIRPVAKCPGCGERVCCCSEI
jgi:DNA-directed RNA polymerase subunit RPC12/RpoP